MVMLIIIRGASGVGKSTIARKVAERLGKGTAHVNVDIFSHGMMVDWEKVPIEERLVFMYDNAQFVVSNFLNHNYNVVTDGMFCRENDLSLLNNMMQTGKYYKADVFVFELEADTKTIRARAMERNREEDKDVGFETIRRRQKIFDKARSDEAVRINTESKSVELCAKEVFESL